MEAIFGHVDVGLWINPKIIHDTLHYNTMACQRKQLNNLKQYTGKRKRSNSDDTNKENVRMMQKPGLQRVHSNSWMLTNKTLMVHRQHGLQ